MSNLIRTPKIKRAEVISDTFLEISDQVLTDAISEHDVPTVSSTKNDVPAETDGQEHFPEDDVFQGISDQILADAISEHDVHTNASNREDPTSNEVFQTVPPNKLADTIPEHPVLAHTISEHQDLHKTSSTTHVPYNASNQEDPPSNKGFQTVPSNILAVTTPEHPVLAHAISEHSIPTVDRNTTKRIVKLKPPTSKDNPKRKRKEEKKISSDNKMNNIKITDVFRRQPKSEQKTTPNKKISGEDNSELETGTDLHITRDVMHQGSKQMDCTKPHSI